MPDASTHPTVTLEIGADVATVWLDRPAAGNTINVQMLDDLKRVVDVLEDRADLPPVVVFRGRGGHFSRGIDLGDFPAQKAPDIHGFSRWEQVVSRVDRLYKATVAVVEGDCTGGGLQLALACDLRLVAAEARLSLPEVSHGFLPGMATWRLAKQIGLGRARRFALSGQVVSGDEALRLGLADERAAAGELDALLERTLAGLGPIQQPAWALTRRLLDESFEFGYEDAIGHLLAAQHRAITSEAFLGLLKAGRGA